MLGYVEIKYFFVVVRIFYLWVKDCRLCIFKL